MQGRPRVRFHYEREMEYFLFVLLIFLFRLALAYILTAERLIKETKNAPFHARRRNELQSKEIPETLLLSKNHALTLIIH